LTFVARVERWLVRQEADIAAQRKCLVVAAMIVMLDESLDGLLKGAREIVVLEQNAVLQGLVPELDLALGLAGLSHMGEGDDEVVVAPHAFSDAVADRCLRGVSSGCR